MRAFFCAWLSVAAAATLVLVAVADAAQPAEGAAPVGKVPPEDETVLPAPKLPEPQGAKKLPDPDQVWVDAKRRVVYVDGYISLREGYLEMFACLAGTKEHESIVAVKARAATVHAALLAVGAEQGRPVQYRPDFRPPTGTEIEVLVRWIDPKDFDKKNLDEKEWRTARAQDWVRHARTKKPLAQPWVFAGSMITKDEQTGKEYYMAEGGELICVSNFATATLDIPIESTDSDDALSFEANTEKIPPLGMPVRLVLKPKLKDGAKLGKPEGNQDAEPRSPSKR